MFLFNRWAIGEQARTAFIGAMCILTAILVGVAGCEQQSADANGPSEQQLTDQWNRAQKAQLDSDQAWVNNYIAGEAARTKAAVDKALADNTAIQSAIQVAVADALAKQTAGEVERTKAAVAAALKNKTDKIALAQHKVEALAAMFEAKKDNWFNFIRYKNQQSCLYEENDPWGHAYGITYTKSNENNTETVWVTSAGPDGEFGTPDDIFAFRVTKFVTGEY